MNKIVITPLGTISPYPKGNRNCPGFLLEYKNEKLLLDCGNGITRLLSFPEVLQNLSVIITHYHKDHFGDIGAIQYASYVYHSLGILKNKVKIYIPKEDYGLNKQSIVLNNESFADYYDITDDTTFSIGDLKITFQDNHSHTIESFMVKIENKEFKIVYTSDIGINNMKQLIEFCKNADLIICESSFLKKHNSNSKTHMTSYDAARLANRSNAKKLILTHLWPEEDRNLYLEEAKQQFENVAIAEEGKKLILKK